MSKNLKKSIPRLRFSEFDGNWEIKKLGDICDCIVPGRNKPKTFNGNIPWITTPDIEHGKINVFSTSLKISYEEAQSIGSKVVPKGSVLMSCAGELGITAITDCEVVINQQLHAFIPHDLINKCFLFLSIKTQKKYIDSIATKTSIPYLNKNNCNSISIPLPSIAEQEKIASFLGSIDSRLTQLRRKHELLQTYKRGVMQKIFAQELRFKDSIGSDFPDWEEKTLVDICTLIKDGTHGTHQDDPNGDYFLLSAKNVLNGRIVYDNSDRKISQSEFDSIYKNYNLQKNDILLSVVGTIGRLAIFQGENNLAFQRSVAFFRLKIESLPSFVYYQMSNVKFQRELTKRQVTSAQPGIYLGDLAKINLYIPSLKEQEKIANFLTAIDKKIEVVAQQIDLIEQFKKGLLQKMFV